MLTRNRTGLRIGTATYTGLTADELATHRQFAHPRPLVGCPLCPPAPCRCGVADCADASAHATAYRSSETTWREPWPAPGVASHLSSVDSVGGAA